MELLNAIMNPIQDGFFRGSSRMQKVHSPLLIARYTYSTKMNLVTVTP